MPITETQALDILAELIKKPESKAADIPRIWGDIMAIYNLQFAPPVEPAPKKKRRRTPNPNIGWPAGVSREEYRGWKDGLMARGVSENLNPQEYKRQRDSGAMPADIAAPLVVTLVAKNAKVTAVKAAAPAAKATAPAEKPTVDVAKKKPAAAKK